MPRKKYSEDTIIQILEDANGGRDSVRQVVRKHGISEPTFYRWKAEFAGLDAAQVRSLRRLKHENLRLRRAVEDRGLEAKVLRDLNAGTWKGTASAGAMSAAASTTTESEVR